VVEWLLNYTDCKQVDSVSYSHINAYCNAENDARSIQFYSSIGKGTILGDLNARCGQKLDYSADCFMFDPEHSGNLHCDLPYRFSMDTVVNTSGTKLIEICLCSDLKLVNGRIGMYVTKWL